MTPKELKDEIDKEFKNYEVQVKEWQQNLELATSQLAYWKLQLESVRTLSTRLLLDGWRKEEEKEKTLKNKK
jgi:hypothetical protein